MQEKVIIKEEITINCILPPTEWRVCSIVSEKLELYKLEPFAHTIDDHANSKVELHTLHWFTIHQ